MLLLVEKAYCTLTPAALFPIFLNYRGEAQHKGIYLKCPLWHSISVAENFENIGVARIQIMLIFEPLDRFSNFKKVKSLEFYQEFKNIGVASATPVFCPWVYFIFDRKKIYI